FSVLAFIHERSSSPVRIVYSHLSTKSLSSRKLRVARYAIVAAPPRPEPLVESHLDLARQVEEPLNRFHEPIELVVSVGVVVDDLMASAKLRECFELMGGLALAVAKYIFDHLPPHSRVALDCKINLLGIDRLDFAHLLQLKDLELQNEVARL